MAVVGEQLRQTALEYRDEAKAEDFDKGVVFGWMCALDLMWGYLEMFDLDPDDLNWQEFVPERDLMGPKREKGG